MLVHPRPSIDIQSIPYGMVELAALAKTEIKSRFACAYFRSRPGKVPL
jgi:hypothetical protein